MKIRKEINNNTCKYGATVYEDAGKIIVRKRDTANYYDLTDYEEFVFNTIADFENWTKKQEWIKTIDNVSNFKKVI